MSIERDKKIRFSKVRTQGMPCSKKKKYLNQASAVDFMIRMDIMDKQYAYKCPTCPWWHLATKKGKKVK